MYKLTNNLNSIIRLEDGATIPEGNNGDWQLYQQWLISNTPDPADVIVTPPREIDARRLRLALNSLGVLEGVQAAINKLPKAAQIDWEFATIIKEDYPLVIQLATMLKINVAELIDLALTFN